MRAPDGTDHWVWGTYREIVEPERLVFTWERQDEKDLRFQLSNLVTVTFCRTGPEDATHPASRPVSDEGGPR